MGMTPRPRTTGLRQFLELEQQREWIEGRIDLPDTADRSESLEHRFKYAARFAKLLCRPQAKEVLEILRLYGPNCIPILRKTERYYWSVSCLPSTSDKPLIRVNASWMELLHSMPRARTSAPDSSCIFRISPKIVPPRRTRWTNPCSSKASPRRRTSVISSQVGRTCSASMCAAPSRYASSSRTAASCAPFGRST